MTRLINSLLGNSVALEEASAGQTEQEIEHTLHGKICDPSHLQQAHSWEDHEQWELDLPANPQTGAKGRMRVRKTTLPDGSVKYVQTTKIRANAEDRSVGEQETSIEVTEDVYNQFRDLASHGMLKRRYMFPIEGRDKPWEIDVFPKEDGSWHEDAKVDLEVPSLDAPLPQLPITMSNLVTKPYGQRSPEEEAYVSDLYKTKFRQSRETIDKILAARQPAAGSNVTTEAASESQIKLMGFRKVIAVGLKQLKDKGQQGKIRNGIPQAFEIAGSKITAKGDQCFLVQVRWQSKPLEMHPGDTLGISDDHVSGLIYSKRRAREEGTS